MGFRVEGVRRQASLQVACLFQNSWRGLAGLSPSAFSEGDRQLTATTNRAVFQHINKKAVQKHVGEGWGGREGGGEGGKGGGVGR